MGNGRLPSPQRVKGNEIVFTDPLHDEEPARATILARHLMWGLGRHGEGLTRLQLVPQDNVQRFHHHQATETGEGIGDGRVRVPGNFLAASQDKNLHAQVRRLDDPLPVIDDVGRFAWRCHMPTAFRSVRWSPARLTRG